MKGQIYEACVKAGLEDIARDIKHYAEVIETTDRHLQEYGHARNFLLKHIGNETALALESQDSARFKSLSKLQVTLAQILREAKSDNEDVEHIIEKQEVHPIYDAFVNAGFEKEARTLSTTRKGKTNPALGHYIAVLENMLEVEKEANLPKSDIGSKRRNHFFIIADKLFDYAKSSPKLYEDLKSILNEKESSKLISDYLNYREDFRVKQ